MTTKKSELSKEDLEVAVIIDLKKGMALWIVSSIYYTTSFQRAD
jgi:hypothetical protein